MEQLKALINTNMLEDDIEEMIEHCQYIIKENKKVLLQTYIATNILIVNL